MKTRQGFVSNSSSSSFVVLTTKQNLDKIRSEASDEFKEFIDVITKGSSQTIRVHGMELFDLSRVVHDGFIDPWDDEEHGRGDVTGYDLWIQLLDEIAKGGGYTHDEGC